MKKLLMLVLAFVMSIPVYASETWLAPDTLQRLGTIYLNQGASFRLYSVSTPIPGGIFGANERIEQTNPSVLKFGMGTPNDRGFELGTFFTPANLVDGVWSGGGGFISGSPLGGMIAGGSIFWNNGQRAACAPPVPQPIYSFIVTGLAAGSTTLYFHEDSKHMVDADEFGYFIVDPDLVFYSLTVVVVADGSGAGTNTQNQYPNHPPMMPRDN